MKIRNGYVSNSSSSSYVIVGKEVGNVFTIDKKDLDFKNENYVCFGKYLCDGEDIIDLDKKKFDFIRKHQTELNNDYFSGVVVRVIAKSYSDEEDSFEFDLETAYNLGNRKVKIYSGEVDYHSTDDIDGFQRNYGVK